MISGWHFDFDIFTYKSYGWHDSILQGFFTLSEYSTENKERQLTVRLSVSVCGVTVVPASLSLITNVAGKLPAANVLLSQCTFIVALVPGASTPDVTSADSQEAEGCAVQFSVCEPVLVITRS